MQYLLAYHETEAELCRRDDPAQAPQYWGAWHAYIGALRNAGVFVSGAGLEPPDCATQVSLRDGQRTIQDGPYAETKEHLGGFVVVEVDGRDAALLWAERSPCVGAGHVEVRPVLTPPPATA
jgi:hypothetical protein